MFVSIFLEVVSISQVCEHFLKVVSTCEHFPVCEHFLEVVSISQVCEHFLKVVSSCEHFLEVVSIF